MMYERQAPITINALPRKSARFGGIFAHPLRFLKWTGCLKYRPVPWTAFNPMPFAEPSLFTAPNPCCAFAEMPWTASEAIDTTMGHSIVVEDGIATCLGYVFDKNGRLIDGGTHKHREGRKYQRWIKRGRKIRPHPMFPKMEYYSGNMAILTASTQGFYFHWLLDVLPRLGILATIQEKVDFVYIEKKHQFQKDGLELLGISGHQIVNSADVALLTAKKLIVPCHQIMNGREVPSWAIQYLRDQFLPVSAGKTVPAKRRLFISRESADYRRLQNERDIVGKLVDYGFFEVKTEKLSFQEQIRLFSEAEVIVAPHGSGLANLVFCSPGATVIELFPAGNIDLYYRLSMALQLKYYYIKDRTGAPTRLTLDNYIISWEDLKKTLDEAEITPSGNLVTSQLPSTF
jgi:capsular polysaccharide biosynthesis protein